MTAVRVGLSWLLAAVWVVGGVVCFVWGLLLWYTALDVVVLTCRRGRGGS